ncbi:MAG: desulfoferrodoxin [Spirochaetaceae bacterium]|nr:desulfoferrodoxin [Spirochaetaceae bacterium]
MKDISFFVTNKGKTFFGVDVCSSAKVVCGEDNSEYTAVKVGSVDAAKEKHVPVIAVNGTSVTVSVGSVTHPMESDHYIVWIALKTEKGFQVKYLQPGEKPEATFAITADDKVVAAYEYCNKHGIWS